MKALSTLAVLYGLLLAAVSAATGFVLRQNDPLFDEWFSAALTEQGTSIEQFGFHRDLSCGVIGFVGLVALALGIAIWRNSKTATRLWLALMIIVSLGQLVLVIARPLPFKFQQVGILDIGIQTMVLILSFVLFAHYQRNEESDA